MMTPKQKYNLHKGLTEKEYNILTAGGVQHGRDRTGTQRVPKGIGSIKV